MADETPKFYPREHCNRVKRSARAMGVKGATYEVLLEILWAMDWRTGKTIMSKDMLIDLTDHCEKTIRHAIAALKKMRIIYTVAYEKGGRGRAQVFATRYFDLDEKGGSHYPPKLDREKPLKGGNNFPKGGYSLPKRGVVATPPSNISNISRDADTPSRGKTDKAPAREVTAENREFFALLKHNSYSEARRIMDERKRA